MTNLANITDEIEVEQVLVKPYDHVDVTLSYQNFGSTWLGVLEGSTVNIQDVFNGIWNLRGTSGELEFFNSLETIGTFWTSRNAMRRFFFNRFYIPRAGTGSRQGSLIRQAMRYALAKLETLRQDNQTSLLNFEGQINAETYSVGKIKAEQPDADAKDKILEYAFADKSE